MQPFEELEVEFANWLNLDPAGMVSCSSGTAALHLALEAFKLPRGPEVIVPDLTMIACPRAVSMTDLQPVFVDCGDDLLMDTSLIAKANSHLTDGSPSIRVIMQVAVYGRVCENDRQYVADVAEEWDCMVVEDLAEAHGVKPHPYTDAACFSFYANKVIHGEEGGAAWFKDPRHATLARMLRCQGFTDAHDFTHVPRGHNYRLANSLAQLVRWSLSQADLNIARRREQEAVWDAACPAEWRMPSRDVPWVYDLRLPGVKDHATQDKVIHALHAAGFTGARHCFKPCHVQPEYVSCRRVGGDVAERMAREVIYLPMDQCHRAGEAFDCIQRILNKG